MSALLVLTLLHAQAPLEPVPAPGPPTLLTVHCSLSAGRVVVRDARVATECPGNVGIILPSDGPVPVVVLVGARRMASLELKAFAGQHVTVRVENQAGRPVVTPAFREATAVPPGAVALASLPQLPAQQAEELAAPPRKAVEDQKSIAERWRTYGPLSVVGVGVALLSFGIGALAGGVTRMLVGGADPFAPTQTVPNVLKPLATTLVPSAAALLLLGFGGIIGGGVLLLVGLLLDRT